MKIDCLGRSFKGIMIVIDGIYLKGVVFIMFDGVINSVDDLFFGKVVFYVIVVFVELNKSLIIKNMIEGCEWVIVQGKYMGRLKIILDSDREKICKLVELKQKLQN